MSTRHRAGTLKQSNKSHKTRFRTKSQVDEVNRGRVGGLKKGGKTRQNISRDARRLRSKQLRDNKRLSSKIAKRKVGAEFAPPHLLGILSLVGSEENALQFRNNIAKEMSDSEPKEPQFPHQPMTVYYPKSKNRVSLAACPQKLVDVLSMAAVADSILLLVDCNIPWTEFSHSVLSFLCSQGSPTISVAVHNLEKVKPKRRSELKKDIAQTIMDVLPTIKMHYIEKDGDVSHMCWTLMNQKRKDMIWRDRRSHVISESLAYDQEKQILRLTGYIRGTYLNVNGLVQLPGVGAKQISGIHAASDPCDVRAMHNAKQHGDAEMGESAQDTPVVTLAEPTPGIQASLENVVEVTEPMEEQTWPTEEEMEEAEARHSAMMMDEDNTARQHAQQQLAPRKVKVPKGWSDYQAAWIVDSDDEGVIEEDDEDEDLDGDIDMIAPQDPVDDLFDRLRKVKFADEDENRPDFGKLAEIMNEDDEVEDIELMTDAEARARKYDEEMEDEQDLIERLNQAEEEREFPDEMETPLHQPASVRFSKYRGLENFRHSPWDPREDLPPEYAKIFKFKNFDHTRRRILKAAQYDDWDVEDLDGFVSPGSYVHVDIAAVTSDEAHSMLQIHQANGLTMWNLLPHENKYSVVHFVLKMHPSYQLPIKSKESLVLHCGFRTFRCNPIFSQHSTGDKHKFERYFQPGSVCVATTFAPIQFPPSPVLAFKETPDGLRLVATGNVLASNPDRLVIKRIRLTGSPYKIFKRSAVIRFMFFNPDDIHWFKPVQLVTKFGRKGHIKESLGTHGHMKCSFDGQLNAQDTIIMNLYKRVYPKWNHQEFCLSSTYIEPLLSKEDTEEMEA